MFSSTIPFFLLAISGLMTSAQSSSTSNCDVSNAYTLEQFVAALQASTTPSSASGSGDGTSCALFPACPYCQQDPTVELCQDWHRTQLASGLNAGLLNGASLYGSIGKRASTTLQCSDSEVCLAATTTLLMCVDVDTFDFKDSNGGNGNLDSDIYTMSNGAVTSVASTATGVPTPTAAGSASGSRSVSKVSATAAAASATATGTVTSSAVLASASSAAERLKTGVTLQRMMILFGIGAVACTLF